MEKIGLFYGTSAVKTSEVAEKIQKAFGNEALEVVPVDNAAKKDFEAYDCLVLGASTWFDGELPSYWDELLPDLSSLKMKGKRIAVFGLGDQVNYPDNFVDGIALLADLFVEKGAVLVGQTPVEGYTFGRSLALRGSKFIGLAIDQVNQPDKTDSRIQEWVKQLKVEFAR